MEIDDEKIADDLLDKVSLGDKNALHELEKLAADGNACAMNNLAQIYFNGLGVVESSYEKAVELFKKAAALDEVNALFRLGEFYRDATYSFKRDGHKTPNISSEPLNMLRQTVPPNVCGDLPPKFIITVKAASPPMASKRLNCTKGLMKSNRSTE